MAGCHLLRYQALSTIDTMGTPMGLGSSTPTKVKVAPSREEGHRHVAIHRFRGEKWATHFLGGVFVSVLDGRNAERHSPLRGSHNRIRQLAAARMKKK